VGALIYLYFRTHICRRKPKAHKKGDVVYLRIAYHHLSPLLRCSFIGYLPYGIWRNRLSQHIYCSKKPQPLSKKIVPKISAFLLKIPPFCRQTVNFTFINNKALHRLKRLLPPLPQTTPKEIF